MIKNFGITIVTFFLLLLTANSQDAKLVLPVADNGINFAKFSPDGKFIASTSWNPAVKIWDVESGKLLHTLTGSNEPLFQAIFANDNKYVLANSFDNAYVWDVITEKLLCAIKNESVITNICISSDQKYIVTSGWDGTIKTWNFMDGKLLKIFGTKKEGFRTTFTNFSPDLKLILTASMNDTVARIWNWESGILKDSIVGFIKVNEDFSATFSPDGKIIVTKSYQHPAQIWDAATLKLLYTKADTEFLPGVRRSFILYGLSSIFSSDGKYILVNSSENSTEIFNSFTGASLLHLENHKDPVQSAISPDNNYVIVISRDKSMEIWQISTGKLVTIIKGDHKTGVTSIGFSCDSKYSLTSSWDGTIKIWNILKGELSKTLEGGMYGSYVAPFSSDSRYILLGSKFWEISTGRLLNPFGFADNLSANFSPHEKYLLTYENDTALIWDASTHKLLNILAGHKSQIVAHYFSPDDKYVITNSEDSIAKIWDMATGSLVGTFSFENSEIIRFNPDSKSFIICSRQFNAKGTQIKIRETSSGRILGTIVADPQINAICFDSTGENLLTSYFGIAKIWSTKTMNMVDTLETIGKNIGFAANYSPNGRTIVIGCDSSVSVWNANTRKRITTLYGHNNYISEALFDPSGKYIFTGSQDGVVKIWDALNYELLHTLKGYNRNIQFSPDGNFLATSSEEGIENIWNLDSATYLYYFIVNDQDDYLVIDNDFHYDGNSAARNLLYFVCGNEIIDLEQFKDLSWEPGLVSKIMGVNKEPITAKGISEINICNYTPRVEEKGYSNGKYNFEIFPRQGGVGGVLLYVNNKEIKIYSPDQLIKRDSTYQLQINDTEIKDYLVPNEDNKVAILALTADKEMRSQGSSISVPKKLDRAAPVHLYSINVGISKYKDDKLKLTYASKDADDFSNIITKSAKKFLNIDTAQHVFTYTFSTNTLDNWPSKDNISKAFEEVAENATANDILVVFLAGHGILKSNDKEFYFLTQEASSFGISGVEKQVAISTEELNDWMRKIKAQKQILVLDACSSGEVVTDMPQLIAKREVPADQQRALERLKDRTGTFILSASASDQSAYESSMYEQGLLTYGLLSSLKYGTGLKDNKFIDVGTWFNSAADNVTQLAKDIGGRQDPQIIGNASFDIGVIDKLISDSIKLTSKKQVFKRSRFLSNTTLLNDELDLSSVVDKELTELSASAIESPIVYVDDNDYREAYSLRGNYIVKNNLIVIDVSIFKGQTKRLHHFELRVKVQEKEKLAKTIIQETQKYIEQTVGVQSN